MVFVHRKAQKIGSEQHGRSGRTILRRFILQYRVPLAATAVMSAASAIVTLGLLAHINELAAGSAVGGGSALLVGLGWLAGLLGFGLISQVVLARLGTKLIALLRIELARRLIDLDYCQLISRKDIVFGALIQDVGQIAPLVLLAPQLAYNAIVVIFGAYYLAKLSFILFAIFFSIMGLSLGVTALLQRMTRSGFDAVRRSEEEVFEHFRSISDGKKEMSLNAGRAQHFAEEHLRPAIERTQHLMTGVHLRWGLNDAWSIGMLYGAVFFVVWLGHTIFAQPQATVIQFVVAGLFLVGPAAFLVHTAQGVGIGMASLRHLHQLGLDLEAEIGAAKFIRVQSVAEFESDWNSIRLEGVSYHYREEGSQSHGCGPIDMQIRRGELIFIVGSNGSGKSTLLLLLCGLLVPQAGQISIDGRNVEAELPDYRSRFSGVFGDAFLFPDVLDGKGRHLSDEKINNMAEMLGLESELKVSGGKLSRVRLSSGQRKRVAMLQCLAEDRGIYVFDEWTAEQDKKSREEFYGRLLPELKGQGKTVVVISHDDRYFGGADRIIKLEGGLVASDGPPGRWVASALESVGGV